jgi:glucose dehydrogenase
MLVSAIFAISAVFSLIAQAPSPAEWRSYAGDLRNHHYSPLARVTAANFNALEVAWRFKTDSLGPRPEYKLEGTPLMAHGVLFTTGRHTEGGRCARRSDGGTAVGALGV